MMSILKEFKEFAMKGNVIDLAVGVIIGTAFGKIVTSLVNDVIMPTFGIVLGQISLASLEFTAGGSTVKYGAFLQAVVDFVIVAFCIFQFIKVMNRFHKKKEAAPPAPKEEIKLLTEIRDALRKS